MSIIPGIETAGARAHGDEQRVLRVAEALARRLLEAAKVLVDLVLEPVGKLAAGPHVLAAGLRRDREAGRDRDPDRGHLREAGSLAAEQLAAGSAPSEKS